MTFYEVLGRYYHEGAWQRASSAVYRHLLFPHSLKQGRLGAWPCPVHLVGQHYVGENGTGYGLELALVQVKYGRASNVRGKEVGSELYA